MREEGVEPSCTPEELKNIASFYFLKITSNRMSYLNFQKTIKIFSKFIGISGHDIGLVVVPNNLFALPSCCTLVFDSCNSFMKNLKNVYYNSFLVFDFIEISFIGIQTRFLPSKQRYVRSD